MLRPVEGTYMSLIEDCNKIDCTVSHNFLLSKGTIGRTFSCFIVVHQPLKFLSSCLLENPFVSEFFVFGWLRIFAVNATWLTSTVREEPVLVDASLSSLVL